MDEDNFEAFEGEVSVILVNGRDEILQEPTKHKIEDSPKDQVMYVINMQYCVRYTLITCKHDLNFEDEISISREECNA